MSQTTLIQAQEKTDLKTTDKEEAKKIFCKEHQLKFDKKTALVCVTYALTDKNGLNLIEKVMEGVLEQNIQLAVTAIGTKKYQDYFTLMSEKYPRQVVIVNDTKEEKEKLYAAADMLICPLQSSDTEFELKTAMSYGVVPLSAPSENLKDYNPNQEDGNAFIQKGNSHWSLFANLIRALENFRFPYDWKNIVKSAMQ